jgi:hypothetical protein
VNDRRREQRIRTLEFGKIVFGRQLSSVDCIVRDLSAGGACLQVDSTDSLPQEFFLKIPVENLKRLCRIAWKAKDRVGVAFQGRSAQAGQWAKTAG